MPTPEWEGFLERSLPGDREAWACVEEALGLTMTEDIWAQKGFFLGGESRSGKGTIISIGEELVGPGDSVSLIVKT